MKIKKFIAAVSAVAISAMSLAAFGSFSAYAEDDARPSSYQFWLAGQYGGNDFWTAGENNNPAVTVSADGTEYTLKVTNTGETNDTDLILFIQSDVNVYKYSTNDTDNGLTNGSINIEVTGIKVDGQSISYSRPANALSLDNDGKSFRLNIWNPHQGGATGPVKEGIDPNFAVSESLEVTFKTSGLFVEAATDAQTDPVTDAPTEKPADDSPSGDGDNPTTTEAGETTEEATTEAATDSSSSGNSSSNNNSSNSGSSSSNNSSSASTTKAASSSSNSSTPSTANSVTVDTGTNADTGDNTNAVAVVMLAITSAGVLAGTRKRK